MATTLALEKLTLGTHPQINPLLEAARDIFSLVIQLRYVGQESAIDDSFYQKMVKKVDQFTEKLRANNVEADLIQQATYALAAFVDEMVLTSNWVGRRAWMSRTLQWKFFNEHNAGEGFFKRLATIRQGGEAKIDLIELYYSCLQLGFEGFYRVRGDEARQALLVDIKAQIDGYRRSSRSNLSGNNVIQKSALTRMGQQIPYWSIFAVSFALLFFIYSSFSIAIHSHANSTLETMTQIQLDMQVALHRLTAQGGDDPGSQEQ